MRIVGAYRYCASGCTKYSILGTKFGLSVLKMVGRSGDEKLLINSKKATKIYDEKN